MHFKHWVYLALYLFRVILRVSTDWDLRSSGLLRSVDRRFGATCHFHLQGSSKKAVEVGPKDCPDIWVTNYQSTLRNTPEDRRSHLHRGGSLSLITTVSLRCFTWVVLYCKMSSFYATDDPTIYSPVQSPRISVFKRLIYTASSVGFWRLY